MINSAISNIEDEHRCQNHAMHRETQRICNVNTNLKYTKNM